MAVEIDGNATRYALLRADTATADTILVDLGGPGIAVLSGQFNLGGVRQALGAAGRRYNLLFIEEPWVTRAVPASCRAALGAFYRSVRQEAADQQVRAQDLATDCRLGSDRPLWGQSATGLRDAVSAITRTESIRLRGVVASSFGAARWERLAPTSLAADVRWTVLVRPYPVGVTGDELATARADAAIQLGTKAGFRPITGEHAIAGRTLPVTLFDQLSAQLRLPYIDDARTVSGVLGGTDAARIAQLSDAAWLRYGAGEISPAYLAYLDEVCDIGGTWPAVDHGRTVRRILVALHLPCRNGGTAPAPRPVSPRRPTCVVTSPNDGVTPESLVRQAYGKLPNVTFVRVTARSHSSSNGLAECLARVRAA